MLESGLLTNDLKQPLDRTEKKIIKCSSRTINTIYSIQWIFINAKKPI